MAESPPVDLDGPASLYDRLNPMRLPAQELRSWRELEREATGCTLCDLHHSRTKVVFGEGDTDADLFILGDRPSRHDDLQGKPFVGGAGNILTNALADAGLTREECYVATVVKCLPIPASAMGRPEVEECAPYLLEQLGHVRPRVIVTLGAFVTQLLLRRSVPFLKVSGYRFDVYGGITLIPTFHPADALKGHPAAVGAISRDFRTAKAVLDGRLPTGAESLAELRARRAKGGAG